MIQKIELTDFQNHATSVIEFGPITVLAGKVGAGKTSVVKAITMALIGRTPQTDLGGRGAKDHIRRGAAEFRVALTMQNGAGTITRTQTDSKQVLISPWGTGSKDAKQALLLAHLGISGRDEVIEVLLDPRLFADRPAEEREQVLLKIVRTPTIVVPQAVQDIGITSLTSVSDIDQHIELLKTGKRRQLNADIKALVASVPVEPTAEEWDKFNSLTRREAELSGQKEGLAAKIGSLQEKIRQEKKAAEDHVKVMRERDYAQQELDGLKPAAAQQEADVKKLGAEALKLQAQADSVRAELVAENAALLSLNRQATQLHEHQDKCFTCGRPISSGEKADIIEKIQAAKAEHTVRLTSLTHNLEFQTAELAKIHKEGQALSAARRTTSEKIAKLSAKLEAPEPTCNAAPTDAVAQELNGVQAAAEKTAEELARVKIDLAGMDTHRRVERTAAARAALSAARVNLERTEAAILALEQLKKGFMATNEAEAFRGALSKVWHVFYPGTDLIVAGGLSVVAGVSTTVIPQPIDVAHLSDGQKVMVDIALRVAGAQTTGFKVLAVDNLNKLSEPEMALAMKALSGSGCQVIVLYTTDDTPPASGERIRWYHLRSPALTGPAVVQRM